MKDNFDSLWLTKRYLEGYRGQKEYISLLESEIRDRYETATNMIAMYEEHIGHSSIERLHPGAKLAMDMEFQNKKRELARAKRIVEQIDRGLRLLPLAERTIIEQRYMQSKPTSWDEIARLVGYDPRWCRRLHTRALRSITICFKGVEWVNRTSPL